MQIKSISKVGVKTSGILLIHGFTSTPESMTYLANAFSNAGYHVEVPLLPGHGTHWQELTELKIGNFYDAVLAAYDRLMSRCYSVGVIGFSMGGALAIHVAAIRPETSFVILINSAVILPFQYKFAHVMKYFVKSVKMKKGSIKDISQNCVSYERCPLASVVMLSVLAKRAKKELSNLNQPLLVFKSEQDNCFPAKNASYIIEHVNSKTKKLVSLLNSYHVAVIDFDKEIIAKTSLDFIANNLK